MISREQARELALAEIRAHWTIADDEPWISDKDTQEEDFGWVFFYNSTRYHETNDFRHRLAGNGPVIVDGVTGKVSMLGTALGIGHQIAEFRRCRKNA